MFTAAWQSLCSIALNIESQVVILLGTRPCLLCDKAITPAALSLKPIYQSRFLCQICIALLSPEIPILVTLNLVQNKVGGEINCISICPYEGIVREAIRAFKYQDKQELAGDLARMLEIGLPQILNQTQESNLLLVAVPLHQSKFEERGFNQSELITRALAKRAKIKCNVKALTRCKATTPQYGLTKSERAINVNKAFSASDKVAGKNIILIDDVLTSGATALACAQALIEAGAQSVSVLTIARALLRSELRTQEANRMQEANRTQEANRIQEVKASSL